MSIISNNERMISEEMVKLIFTPIKESLITITSIINDTTNHIKELAHLNSLPPSRAELLDKILFALDKTEKVNIESRKDLKIFLAEKIQEHDNKTQNKITELNLINTENRKISSSLIEISRRLDKTVAELLSSNKENHGDSENKLEDVEESIRSLKDDMMKLSTKLGLVLSVISVTFTLSLIGWGIISFIITKAIQ